ncbi:MAG: hypothetical protein ACRCZF_13620, partial [Gemmataceae bacterium]
TFQDDWDGEGSEAPLPALSDRAIHIAQYFREIGIIPPDRVHASVNATIYLEWMTPIKYIEVEVVSAQEAECRVLPKGSTETEIVYLAFPS